MAIKFIIGGSQTVIPGVYSRLLVANSLPAPAPAGRSVLIIGEAEEGIPGSDLDLRLNYYTKFNDLKEFYKSGPIVNAGRMLFSSQPSGEFFPGRVERVYVYKTNASERAEREIEGPSNYGDLVAARYGEDGNLIKTQILDAQSESKPSKTFLYLPSPAGRDYRVVVNGKLNSSIAVAANAVASAYVTAVDALVGVSASGGLDRTVYDGGTGILSASLAASDDTLTVTQTAGDTFAVDSIEAGDVCYIEPGTGMAGASDENAGAYVVVSVTASSLVIKRLKNCGVAEENFVAFNVTAVVDVAEADWKINGPVTVAKTEATPAGMAATLELLEDNADVLGSGMMVDYDSFTNLFADATSSIANIEASVPAAGYLKIDINTGTWVQTPSVGDLIYIDSASLLAGSTSLNVGIMVVTAVGPQSITAKHLFAGMTTEAVASVAMVGANGTVQFAASFVSSSLAAKRLDSSAERKVKIEASNVSSGATLSEASIGGRTILEIGYYNAAATACTLSISALNKMTISPTGTGLTDIVINLMKYKTLSELIAVLNTKAGISAKASDNLYNSLNPNVLDAVDAVDIMDGQGIPAYNGKVKSDYADWKQFFEDNFSLLAFREGTMQLKSGLPDAEDLAVFLAGAVIGASSSSDFQNGLDAGLKINVRQVVPLVSRDSIKDILDGLTDEGSTYSIDSVHAAIKAHVATASSQDFARERFGIVSYDGSFTDSKTKCSTMAYERIQVTFQRHSATDGSGELVKMLPWISACALAAGRSQAFLSTSMLRKPFLLSSAEHTGADSIYSDTLIQDFDPEDSGSAGMLAEAITAGLIVFREVEGFGVRMESPDNTSRSRVNDPQGWVYERAAVLFALDEVSQTIRSVLDNFIGRGQVNVSVSTIRQAITDVVSTFLPGDGNGALEAASINDVARIGTKYHANVSLKPTEALEAITIDVLSTRDL